MANKKDGVQLLAAHEAAMRQDFPAPRVLSWQPIETAPKETAVLTFRRVGLMAVAEYVEPSENARIHGWRCTGGVFLLNVTHWMPLPDPPTAK